MDIIIDDSNTLLEVQKKFSKHFLYLKLEFFGFETNDEKVFSKENMIKDLNKTIGEVRHHHLRGHVSINGQQKVSTLENHFRENFGINVQVFRKSGNAWLQTIATDDWTLAEQNKKGEEMNESIVADAIDDNDSLHEQP